MACLARGSGRGCGMDERQCFETIADELVSGTMDRMVWAQAMRLADSETGRARAIYARLRNDQLGVAEGAVVAPCASLEAVGSGRQAPAEAGRPGRAGRHAGSVLLVLLRAVLARFGWAAGRRHRRSPADAAD